MARVLLVNPSMAELYEIAKVKSSVPAYFPLNLLTIAGPLLEKNHEVKLLDLNLHADTKRTVIETLQEFSPDYVCFTFTTPLYSQTIRTVSLVKGYDAGIAVVAGGAHITSDFMNTMKNSKIDIAVIGEGDFKLLQIVESKNRDKIRGIAFRRDGDVVVNEREPLIKDLDMAPFPATELVDIAQYRLPHTLCRQNPVFPLETSRGCVYGCVYCNKSVFGRNFRAKSTTRVLEDLKRIAELGFKEVHIIDDGFTTDMLRAKEICRRIVQERIKLHVACPNGIRADRVDLELLQLMKQAGVHMVAFGVETGSQRILDLVNKGLDLAHVIKAFDMCRQVGLETFAFFMFGLPEETEEDLKTTIRFAKKLNPDVAKFDIMIPLPSTPIFEDWKKNGYIVSDNWDDYGFHKEKKVYNHPYLSTETLSKYMQLAYKSFYFSPRFVARRSMRSLRNRTLLKDLRMLFDTKW